LLIAAAGLAAMAGAAPERAPIFFNTNFEGASLGKIERLGETTFRCHVQGQHDERGRNRQASWYYFRMDGVRGRDITLTLTDFVGEYNDRPGACPMGPDIIPVVSDDGEIWRPVPSMAWNDRAKEAVLHLRPERESVWIAHQQPYTTARLARLLAQVDRCEDARIEVIGKSVQGRDLHLITVTSADSALRDKDKVTVWLQARQHAWESGTSYVMEGALRFVTSVDPSARALRRKVVFMFTPMVDPDGCAAGKVRFNANGFDLNRHWDEVDLHQKQHLVRMPEIWYVKKTLCACVDSGRKVHVMINLHNTEIQEYLATMAADEASRALVAKLSDRLVRGSTFRPSHGPVLGARRDGSANVLQAEKGILILLLEQRIAKSPSSGRPPTASDRLDFGRQLIRIMAESVLP
jgi:hypothetical protein